jgi:hypothetical protein
MGDFLEKYWKVIIAVIVIIILYKVLNSLFGEGKGAKAGKKVEHKLDFNKKNYSPSMPASKMSAIRKAISDEWDNYVSSDAKILAQLKKLRTQGDIQTLNAIYNQATGYDLYSVMKKRLSQGAQEDIFNYWMKLPNKVKD